MGDDPIENNDVSVSYFDYSVENFSASMDSIKELCGLPGAESFDAGEIERFSSMITFLKEWKYFVYEPKTINFTHEIGGGQVKDDFDGITLPQFSSAAVPKIENSPEEAICLDSDFVLHAGGSVWAMDWCPRNQEKPDNSFKCEYLTVAAHPPGSTYHKIGVPLTGRGIIQIWCLLSLEEDVENCTQGERRLRGRPKGSLKYRPAHNLERKEELTVRKPRGRPKGTCKKQLSASENDLNDQMESASPVNAFVLSMGDLSPSDGLKAKEETIRRPRGRPKKELTVRKPRGRPKGTCKKQLSASENDLNDKMESTSPVNALVLSMGDLSPLDGLKAKEETIRKPRGRPKKELTVRKPRGRPKGTCKKQLSASEDDLNDKMESASPAVNTLVLSMSDLVPSDGLKSKEETVRRPRVRPKGTGKRQHCTSENNLNEKMEWNSPGTKRQFPCANECDQAFDFDLGAHIYGLPTSRRSGTLGGNIEPHATATDFNGKLDSSSLLTSLREFEHEELTVAVAPINDHYQGQMVLSNEMTEKKFCIPKDSVFPKVVLCLAHMGKVAWDVKWRPANANDSEDKHHLGYLAVLLGNGSLEVWEVPVPNMVKILHDSRGSEGTDPRFLKLKPIFRCSKVECGNRQSIPLTLEWSPSAPHDLILTGCHDGTVALWKFSKQHSSQDVKPLLCFSADCVPIRALAWAPEESDVESVNLMVTAGHEGLKFWDIRDPYRPLCEFCPGSVILSLQWLRDPRCIIMSLDDGELRMLSLWKVANNFLVTGEPPRPSKQTGSFYCCSHSAIWSCQVSRTTGTTAYCTADGSVRHFKLTANAVEKDPSRYRERHFLCGSFSSDEKIFKIKSTQSKDPLPNIPWKKTITGLGDAPLAIFLSNQPGGYDQTPPVIKSKSKSRCSDQKSGSKISDPCKPPCQALITTQADEGTLQLADGTEEGCARQLPPKDVAIHKVRWNINKGSERWLCYGGAAGIVRCQKIYSGTT